MKNEFDRKLILEDGSQYYGYAFGSLEDRVTEIVFNTSPVGYQEILSDPSYTYQTVVFAYPLIGNYGIADEDFETDIPSIGGLVVRDYNDIPSNFRSKNTLDRVMKQYKIPGIYGVDTRKLVRSIRNLGSRKVLMTGPEMSLEKGLEILQSVPWSRDVVAQVSRREICRFPAVCGASATGNFPAAGGASAADRKFHVVAVDCGMKQNIVRSLNNRKCDVTAVPWNTTAEEVEALKPDGIFLSNGPGDPEDAVPVIELVRKLRGKYPIFGICLGHQMIALAYGAGTYKLKFGHRGGNHPVKNLLTGKIEITSQNHSYAVDADSVEKTPLTITHINLLDNTVEGLECRKDKLFSVQYHPESAPGPQDSSYLFDRFLQWMEDEKDA